MWKEKVRPGRGETKERGRYSKRGNGPAVQRRMGDSKHPSCLPALRRWTVLWSATKEQHRALHKHRENDTPGRLRSALQQSKLNRFCEQKIWKLRNTNLRVTTSHHLTLLASWRLLQQLPARRRWAGGRRGCPSRPQPPAGPAAASLLRAACWARELPPAPRGTTNGRFPSRGRV